MRPAANTTRAKDPASARFLPVRLVRREPRHHLAIVDLGWQRGGGPLFFEDLATANWRDDARVALYERHVVGYLHLRQIGPALAIRHLCVTRPLWRLGIGGQLLAWARDQLVAKKKVLLACRIFEDNLVGHRFLVGHDFADEPRTKKDRQAGIYRYVWRLPGPIVRIAS